MLSLPNRKIRGWIATGIIAIFIDKIFRVLLAYLKYFYEFCIKVVHTMIGT